MNQEALSARAKSLEEKGLNGLKLVLVDLPDSTKARLEVYLHNENEIDTILGIFETARTEDKPIIAEQIFPIVRCNQATIGTCDDQVKAIEISRGSSGTNSLLLIVKPIGDYSTYTLQIDHQNIDPIFSKIDFKFRPGCFNLCAPEWKPSPMPRENPAIDYLSKDYESFKHAMITAMMERVPGWEPTSEADLDQVLLELFSAAADELSDYQDRVINEAFLGTARNRVSLARHARMMDYHIHEGNQASTWLAVKVFNKISFLLPERFVVWAGNPVKDSSSVVFMTRREYFLSSYFNEVRLYTWSDSIPSLREGSTEADLKITEDSDELSAMIAQGLIRDGKITHLLIQEWKNPETGEETGRDPLKRQLLKLLSGDKAAEALMDPLTNKWFVRVRWEERDQLKRNYCFTVDCPTPIGKVENISLFHGNLIEVYHGRSVEAVFKEPGTILTGSNEFYFARTGCIDMKTSKTDERWGSICRLPEGPLEYKATPLEGNEPPESTLEVEVETSGSGIDKWDEVPSLIHSDNSDEQGDHFVVETDEERRSLIRFGNGINGKRLPDRAAVHCLYQVGTGLDGNIGADKLNYFDETTFQQIEKCWNPLDVKNGKAPEPVEEIIRRVPEAYRLRQLRAVTLKDYIDRAEEIPEVFRAAAKYAWTGSWRTVQIAIDPVGTTVLTDEVRKKVANHLNAVRLIGEDLEIRPPRFVPLKIFVSLCIHPEYWPEDIKYILEQEFSDGFTPDGRMGFFHPDRWTFGQELRDSQIIGWVQSIKGVDLVLSVIMKRWSELTPGKKGIIEVMANEIIQVKNDWDHIEKGFIFFDAKGGRR